MLGNAVPSVPGGGTVFYVTDSGHRYLENAEEREEGGTPDIIGAIRCGLVFLLKDSIGVPAIRAREAAMMSTAASALRSCPSIRILGPWAFRDDVECLPVTRCPLTTYLRLFPL